MALFQPLVVGSLTLQNRFIMAPLTRCRATIETHVPTEKMITYYAQRASAGLIIAEATMVTENQSAFYAEPGIYSSEQVAAWKKVTDAVHAKGGKIALQIWHGGRACCPLNNKAGVGIVAPSAIQNTHGIGAEFNPTGAKVDAAMPHELTDEEIKVIIGEFVRGAKNAIEAGFDAIEIHAANGYLIDEFWRSESNKRPAPYGGSVEARCKFMLDIVDGVSAAIGADRVGIRLSPVNSYNDMRDEDPVGLTAYTAKQLSARKIAYLHMMRADFFGAQKQEVLSAARANFEGPLFANMGYEIEEAETAVASKALEAVVFGTKFLANPDLPERARLKKELNPLRPQFFYSHGEEGYTDYPALSA